MVEPIDAETLAAAKRRAEAAQAEVQKQHPNSDMMAYYWLAFSPWDEVSPSYCLYLIAEVERLQAESDGYDDLVNEVEHLRELDQTQRNEIAVMDGEIERLRSENAAMREIVQAVAGTDGTPYGAAMICPFCEAASFRRDKKPAHAADCAVVKARALLGTQVEG